MAVVSSKTNESNLSDPIAFVDGFDRRHIGPSDAHTSSIKSKKLKTRCIFFQQTHSVPPFSARTIAEIRRSKRMQRFAKCVAKLNVKMQFWSRKVVVFATLARSCFSLIQGLKWGLVFAKSLKTISANFTRHTLSKSTKIATFRPCD